MYAGAPKFTLANMGRSRIPRASAKALQRTRFTALRGPFALDRLHAPVQNTYILRVEKAGARWVNRVIHTIPNVNQFWTWEPEEYMKLPGYSEMQGKWARGGR